MVNIKDITRIIVDKLGYKATIMYINSEEREIGFMMYDSFLFKCGLEEQYNTFGCGLQLSDGTCSKYFLNREISLNSDEESIRESLQVIDDYCRLRLPDKFLDAYYKAYVLSQYEDCDL